METDAVYEIACFRQDEDDDEPIAQLRMVAKDDRRASAAPRRQSGGVLRIVAGHADRRRPGSVLGQPVRGDASPRHNQPPIGVPAHPRLFLAILPTVCTCR